MERKTEEEVNRWNKERYKDSYVENVGDVRDRNLWRSRTKVADPILQLGCKEKKKKYKITKYDSNIY